MVRELLQQFVKFALAGVLSFGVEALVLYTLHEFLGLHTVVASVIAYVTSISFNYVISMRHIYTHRSELSRRREYSIYLLLAVVGLMLNTAIMWAASELFVAAGVDYEHSKWYLLVKVVATALVGLWNFFSRRHWLDAEARS